MEALLRMKDAIDYMEANMSGKLEIGEVARIACMSPFHFQRMFHMLTGVTVAEYVRNRRLTLAAQELAISSRRVLDVALAYGYESPESFAKAFRRTHGIAPSDARDPGVSLKAYPRITFHLSLKGDQDMDYRLMEKEAFPVIGKARQFRTTEGENMREIPKFWLEAMQDGTEDRLIARSPGKDLLGICMDMEHGSETFTYMIGLEASDADADRDTAAEAEEFVTRVIPAATWAVFPSVGPMPHSIQKVWGRIFSEWFPATGYEHAGGPELEVYPLGDSQSEDYRCEIWIPIVRK